LFADSELDEMALEIKGVVNSNVTEQKGKHCYLYYKATSYYWCDTTNVSEINNLQIPILWT
jgi:hypothetical protein